MSKNKNKTKLNKAAKIGSYVGKGLKCAGGVLVAIAVIVLKSKGSNKE